MTLTSWRLTKVQAPTTPIYSLIEDPLDDIYNIRIDSGVAQGTVFRYGNVRFLELTEGLRVQYDYQIIQASVQLTAAEFQAIISSILNDILRKENQEQHG